MHMQGTGALRPDQKDLPEIYLPDPWHISCLRMQGQGTPAQVRFKMCKQSTFAPHLGSAHTSYKQ